MLKCYRIWFDDGSAILRDAENEQDAIGQGITYLDDIGYDPNVRVKVVESLAVIGRTWPE